jgi:outer membrane protein assembly factor BamA
MNEMAVAMRSKGTSARRGGGLWVALACGLAAPAAAQPEPQTRAAVIQQERQEKEAVLWPERQSPLVDRVNRLVERGFREGLDTGQGADGPQIVLGGMRSGQGFSLGIGYRRRDLWRDRLGYRATFRGTKNLAYLLDLDVDFKSLRSERSFVNWYTKYESSPRLDYYGQSNDSNESDRTSYLLEDLTTDVNAGFEPVRFLRLGLTGGFMDVHTGPGKRGGVPSIEERFDSTTAPGLGDDPAFARWGIFAYVDHRNARSGPRSGGLYGARFRQFADLDLKKYSFRQAQLEAQHYLPYFNRTRVIALRAATSLSFPKSGQLVPYYLQPTIGGNNDVRGFPRYRYHDNHSIFFSAEHRWHGFTGLDTALFIDAGKVIARKADVDLSDLRVSVGFGFRVRVADAVVMRMEIAAGREGLRTMWTFSDIYKVRW